MKKCFFFIFLIISLCCTFLIIKNIYNDNSLDKSLYDNSVEASKIIEEHKLVEPLINIDNCSEQFMENYFEKSKNINDYDNILIITSKKEVKDTFGACEVIEAPNNQYFLKYNSEEEKNNAFNELKRSDTILYIEENNVYNLCDANYNSWGIEKIGLDNAIKISEENKYGYPINDITVAIIDTGCDMELFNKSYPGKINETYNIFNGKEMYDSFGHGTHIAGTIAEGTPSNISIFPIKVSNSKKMDTVRIINAINYITYYKKANIINMSFGSTNCDMSLYVAIQSAAKQGILSIAAAGNEKTSISSYPASFDNTISVSAVDNELNFAEFSNYGDNITFCAPGVDIQSINGLMSGTSMATPHVVSAVAMLKSYNKSLNLEQVIKILKNTSLDLGNPGWDKYYGYGLIDLSNFDNLILQAKNSYIESFELNEVQKVYAKYGNITNLMNLELTLNDAAGNKYTKLLSDIDNLEIKNYDPFKSGNQEIVIKYNNIEKKIIINNISFGYNAFEYHILDENKKTISIDSISDGQSMPKKIYIPEYIDDYKVVAISDDAFKDVQINSIILPSTVTSIGNRAFYNSSIKSITGGSNEVAIGSETFFAAHKLEKFEPTISSLGNSAFCDVYSINNLKLSDNIELISEKAFCNCTNLENINFPNKLVEISDFAFSGTKIKSLDISKILVNISLNAFRGVSSLEMINVDPENPVYDSRENCNALIETSNNTIILGSSNTVIPDTIHTIGNFAFYNNIKIQNINTNKIITIGESAFEGCLNLKKFYLCDSVENLSSKALCDLPNVIVYTYSTKYQTTLFNNRNRTSNLYNTS